MDKDFVTNRAWVEINLNNLEHNVKEIQKNIHEKTKIMAVVKANAYGHGLVIISKKLNEIGIKDFAVATLEEGITLRKNGIVGNILILGYTNIKNIKYVLEYDLIQTVVSLEYAKELLELNLPSKLKVHLKINTGMNRIGISYKEIEFLKSIYNSKKLNILGIYTHCSASDSAKKSDIKFTRLQISRFNYVLDSLKASGIEVIGTHLQASYGIVNYKELEYDYVRPGMILYGTYTGKDLYVKNRLSLKPVLALKARVASVNEIEPGEAVGYSRLFRATKKEKIAAVSIGYVDGYPRNLSPGTAKVMVNGLYGVVVGRICMDQLNIKVTNIENIKEGDIVTLIGDKPGIMGLDLAYKTKTIVPELFGRLGSRLNYVVLDEKQKE